MIDTLTTAPRFRSLGFPYARYSENCFAKFIELCMETPCWCPSEGHQYGGRKVTETSLIEETKNYYLWLRHIAINTSSNVRTVHLAKT